MVKTGLEVLKETNFSSLKLQSIGVLCNPTSVDSNYNHIINLLLDAGVSIKKVFGPEHGVFATAQDMEEVTKEEKPTETPFQTISLYGPTLESIKPKETDLADIDTLVIDIQDVGSRYYTYAQTMAFCMEAAKKTNTKVIVLDRPNPIDGINIEGFGVNYGYESFCGLMPVANRHGLTLAELALVYNSGFKINDGEFKAVNCKLEVVKMKGWNRDMFFDETSSPWVLPSPNMPTLDTAVCYPGGCLFEATQLSEGRGTTKPFEIFGAPYINSQKWKSETLKILKTDPNYNLETFVLRECSFKPMFQKHANQICHGLQVHVKDKKRFFSYRLYLALIVAAFRLYPNQAKWREEPYEFISDVSPIDLLYGSSLFREEIVESETQNYKILWDDLNEFENQYKQKVRELFIY